MLFSYSKYNFIYIICVCLRIVVSNKYRVGFCSPFFRLVYPMLSVSLACPFLIFPSVFSKVYLTLIRKTLKLK